MRPTSLRAFIFGATALTALPLTAVAQERVADCEELYVMFTDADIDYRDVKVVREVMERNSGTQCVAFMRRVERVGGAERFSQIYLRGSAAAADSDSDTASTSESFSASETLTRTVEIEQKAIVEGEVVARIPEPEVAVEVPGPRVNVVEAPARVAVEQSPMTVTVRQKPAKISVRIPKPVVTIEQPAPRIIVVMDDPDVGISRERPTIRVEMPEPRIRVTQGEPELDVDVEARLVDADAAVRADEPTLRARSERIDAGGNIVTADQDIGAEAVVGEAEVVIAEPEQQDRFTFARAKPQIVFESADPTVAVMFDEEPEIDFRQLGEATIAFARPGEVGEDGVPRRQRRQYSPEEARGVMMEDSSTDEAGIRAVSYTPADLMGMDVYTRNDDYVGDIDRIVRTRNGLHVIVEHGGFLGIGDTEVALPQDRIAIVGADRAILLGMTEEQFERLPDVDFDESAEELGMNDSVELGYLER